VPNDRHEDTDYSPPTSAWKKNIEQFLFSKLTPRHHEHGTGPGTHLKRHTVGGQTTRTKQNAILYHLPTTRLQQIPNGFETRSSVRDNYTSQHARTSYTGRSCLIHTVHTRSYKHAYNIFQVD